MSEILIPLFISLKVTALSTGLVFITATLLALLLVRTEALPGKGIIEALFILPLVLPPTVTGFGLLIIFGKYSPLGKLTETFFHSQLLFTWWAAVIASAVVSFPLMYQNAKAAFSSVDVNQEKVARTLGANEMRIFFTITFPLAWPGILAGLVLSFSRALGEFGATLMVAGNIPGKTQTIPMAIYFAVEEGNIKETLFLVTLVIVFSLGLILWLNVFSQRIIHYTEKRRA